MGVLEVARGDVGRIEKIAEGNQAVVYRAPDLTLPGLKGPFVYKEYKPKVRAERPGIRNSLSSLIRLRDDVSDSSRAIIDKRSAWPLAVVLDGELAIGLIMRELPAAYFTDIHYFTGRVARLVADSALYLQSDDDLRDAKLTVLTESGRMWLVARTLGFMNVLHNLGVVVGDFSGNNVAFAIDAKDQSRNQSMLVDADSFRLASGVPAFIQAHTPDWETPESVRNAATYRALVRASASPNELARAGAAMRVQDKASDVYKAALFVLRNFHVGENAHSVTQSESALKRLTDLQPGFVPVLKRALSDDPKQRPSMNDLTKAFKG